MEGDWSNAAFLLALGEGVTATGLRAESLQGDRVCRDMLRRLQSPGAQLDLTACPDLGPVLFAAAARAHGAVFTGTRRLRIKESDRLSAMAAALTAAGADVSELPDGLIIRGGKRLHAAKIEGCNDHRIVMAMTMASEIADGELTITDAEATAKSAPAFWREFEHLGGLAR